MRETVCVRKIFPLYVLKFLVGELSRIIDDVSILAGSIIDIAIDTL